jgi:hypothetical protein
MTLREIQEQNGISTDKESSRHTYLDIYEELFSEFKDEEISILEIGVLNGESIKLWLEYFKNATICGIDTFKRIPLKDVIANLGDYDEEKLFLAGVDSVHSYEDAVKSRKAFFDIIGDTKFKVIIDDGLHTLHGQLSTYDNFNHLLDEGGIYIIEDIPTFCHTCNQDWYGHLATIKKTLPMFEIIDMNHKNKSGPHDNIIGVYKK